MALQNAAAAAEFVPGNVTLNVLGSSQGVQEFVPRLADFSSSQAGVGTEQPFNTIPNDPIPKTSIKFMPSHVDAPEFFPGSTPKPSGFESLVGRAGEFRPSYQFGNSGNTANPEAGSMPSAHISEFISNAHPQYVESDDFIGITDNIIDPINNQGVDFGFDISFTPDSTQPSDNGAKKDLEFETDYGVHEKEGWAEVASTSLATNGLDQDTSIVYATFDPVEELVWAGTASGRICSHLVQYSPQDCR